MSCFQNVLTPDSIAYINDLPEIKNATDNFEVHYRFCVSLPQEIIDQINTTLGTQITNSEVPMSLFQGDISYNKEHCNYIFKDTYLIYLDNSTGTLVLGDYLYPIVCNTGYKFNTYKQATMGTEENIILTIGPMDINGNPV